MTTLRIETPRVFLPLLATEPRYFGARGGRGSGKSHFFCEQLVEEMCFEHIRGACLREVQNSIKDSVKQLIEDKIRKLGVESLFKVTENEIVGPNDSLLVFKGLRNHTVSSIKSLEGFNRAFVEEAQTISQKSLDIAIPTFRVPGAKLRFSWNPDKPTDPIETFFDDNKDDPDFVLVHANYNSNPWFAGSALQGDMERDQRNDPDKYAHVWLGAYAGRTESKVFRNWRVQEFTSPPDATFRFGADWGFAIDPTTLIRGFIGRMVDGVAIADPAGRCLFIDHEAYSVACEIDQTPALFDTVPRSRDFRITADSARPETVSYMKRNGFPKIVAAVKGPGSIEDGISFLQTFEIVIHPRCQNAIREFGEFSYKIDKQTDEILPFLDDKNNHVIDAARYALEGLRRARPAPKPDLAPKSIDRYSRLRERAAMGADGDFY